MKLPSITMSLALATGFVIALIAYRQEFGAKTSFMFLTWNLFLAWIPYGISSYIAYAKPKKLFLFFLGSIWLLFFPNAPYLLTDLIHIKTRLPVPLWYDVLLMFMAAFVGLMLAITSLKTMLIAVGRQLPTLAKVVAMLALSVLTSMGVYLGRFERLNSWDVFVPLEFLGNIKALEINKEMVLFVIVFTGVFVLCSLVFYARDKR